MNPKLVIWGASGHALVVADIIRLRAEYEIIGFLDDVNPERRNTEFYGYPILGGQEQLDFLQQSGVKYVIFGFGDCEARLRLSRVARAEGFDLVTAVHPQAVIASDVTIGRGTVIVAGAVVNPGAKIGENVIINTCASVDHECIVEDGAHICPGVHLAGRVIVGRASWIGIGATVKEKVKIGANVLIGAGAVVVKDVPDDTVACGVPARARKKCVASKN